MRRVILALATLMILTGCGFVTVARVTVNDPIRPGDVSFIEPGKTTLREVVDHLGTPDELDSLTSGAVVTYHFRDAKYSRVNLGWPLQFVLPVRPDLTLSGWGLGTEVFVVTLDRSWIVQASAFGTEPTASRFDPLPIRGLGEALPTDCR